MAHADGQQETNSRRSRDAAAARRRENAPAVSPAFSPPCPACGASPRRAAALYCAACGNSLREREYAPADALRASYRWQRAVSPNARRADARAAPPWRRRDGQTARAYVFLALALAPLVGVAFGVCAFASGVSGLRHARREGDAGQAADARCAVVFAVLLTGAQAILCLFVLSIPVWLD